MARKGPSMRGRTGHDAPARLTRLFGALDTENGSCPSGRNDSIAMAQKNDASGAWPFMVAAGAAGMSTLPFLLLWDRLPDPIAIHWSISGTPDGNMPKIGFLAFNCLLLGVVAVAAGRRGASARNASDAGPLFLIGLGGTFTARTPAESRPSEFRFAPYRRTTVARRTSSSIASSSPRRARTARTWSTPVESAD